MLNMKLTPGNSFPQICVVSVNEYVQKGSLILVNIAHISKYFSCCVIFRKE